MAITFWKCSRNPSNLKATAPIDRSKEPAPGSAMSLNLPAMQKATLSNGLKIVLAERHTAPVGTFSLLVQSGYAADPRMLWGLAASRSACLRGARPRAIR